MNTGSIAPKKRKMCDGRNLFCYVCGLFVDKSHCLEFKKNQAVVEAFNHLFKCSYVESAWYEPEYVCSTCSTILKKWKSGKSDNQPLSFETPMAWHYQAYHKSEDCYFCQTNTVGHHYKTRNHIKYADVLTVSRPTPKTKKEEPTTNRQAENFSEPCHEFPSERNEDPSYVPTGAVGTERHFVSNHDYSDLARDLHLSLEETEILGSRLKQWNIVEDDFKVTFLRNRDLSSFEDMFKADDIDNKLVYCVDVDRLFAALDHEHYPKDWRLFLDGSCKSEYFICHKCEKTKSKQY